MKATKDTSKTDIKQKIAFIILSTSVFIFTIIGLRYFVAYGVYKDAYFYVCDLVVEKFIFKNATLNQWGNECRTEAQSLPFFTRKENLIALMRQKMLSLRVSHLDIYSPVENQKMWRGEARHTGIKVHLIDGSYVVSRIIQGSPAERSGVRVGDIVDKINGESIHSAWQVETGQGEFEFKRHMYGKPTKFNKQPMSILAPIVPVVINIDQNMSLEPVTSDIGVLTLPSFRSDFFANDSFLKLFNDLHKFKKIIIDLRGNSGGNFVAMLRALSPFYCQATQIGVLYQPRKKEQAKAPMSNKLNDELQYNLLKNNQKIELYTYGDYGCYTGRLIVLMDNETSSVAEIFAHAIKERGQSYLLGGSTSGDVVLGVWYGLDLLGKDYSLSIPEAIYQDNKGQTLEGVGLAADKELYYDFNKAIRGIDTWLAAAIEF